MDITAIHLFFHQSLLLVAAVAPTCRKGNTHALPMCSVGCASLQKGIIHNCILVHFIIYLKKIMMFNFHQNYIHLFKTFKKDN